MKTSFWRRWCDSVLRAKKAGPISRGRPRRPPLGLEALEDRVTPSLTPQMVLDINPGGANSVSIFSELVAIGAMTYFRANDGVHGIDLWKSDGTVAGTVLVKDFSTGVNSYLRYLTNVNGTLFFSVFDGTHGNELWKSDGTPAGTVMVKDIRAGSGSSNPGSLTNVSGTLFFSAHDGTHGFELWRSDGTAAGTTLVKDINPGGAHSYPRSLTNVNGTLMFAAADGAHGVELWKSDGTAAGTVELPAFDPSYLENVNGTLFFSAFAAGQELFKSDGTAAGTVMVKDINPGFAGSSPLFLTNVNGTLFFRADDGTHGSELWRSDGTAAGTTLVKDIAPGGYTGYYGGYYPSSSIPSNLTNQNGTLFFTAHDATHGWELWKSDGTPAGTTLVKDINLNGISNLANINGTVFFAANDGAWKLWQSDGTAAGTVPVANLFANNLTNVNDTLFFTADDGVHGWELWKLVDDGRQSVRIGDAAVTEGHEGTLSTTFTVTLSTASDQPVTVAYATADGSATAGSDYQSASGTLTIPAGQTAETITVSVIGDRIGEQNETFVVNLSGATNAEILDTQGVGTIVDDEPRISIGDATVIEGNIGTRVATFTVTLSAASGEPVTVAYATASATATAGSDYQSDSGTLTIPAGQTTRTITVVINGDRLHEPDETFFVNLSSPTNAIVANNQAIGAIVDDEPRISISDVTRSEGKNRQTTLFIFTVTLATPYDQPVTMSFATANGTATTSNNDYVARAGTLTFAPGETTKTITIEVKGDSKKEANETFYLDLFGNSGNSLFTKSRGLGTILNDD